jgi:hypothetical protein
MKNISRRIPKITSKKNSGDNLGLEDSNRIFGAHEKEF